MVDVSFRLKDIGGLPATATITMTVKEWKEFRDLQSRAYPASKVTAAIDDVVSQMEQAYLRFGGDDG